MATFHVRYRSSEADEWELNDQMDLSSLWKMLRAAAPTSICSFGVAARNQATAFDYGMVGLRMVEVASWHIDGMLEEQSIIGPWLELLDGTRQNPEVTEGDE